MQIEIPGVTLVGRAAEPVSARSVEEQLGKTAFLELMIAQIQNQDPLSPAKNEAFIAQLAQFSSVEGIQNLNESMDGLVSTLRTGLTMDAAALVGRNVLAPGNQSGLNAAGGIAGTIDLQESVGDLQLEIRDVSGSLVKTFDLGAQEGSTLRFSWDGTTDAGTQVQPGIFQLSAFSQAGGERVAHAINLPERVVSVSITDAGLVANLSGGTAVPTVQIKEIQ